MESTPPEQATTRRCPGATRGTGCAGSVGDAGRIGAGGTGTGWSGFGVTGWDGAGLGVNGTSGAGLGVTGAGVSGTGCAGMGCAGVLCDGPGCAGCMGGRPGLRVCAGVFKTKSILMTVKASSVRIFLYFIIFLFGCLCQAAVKVLWRPRFRFKLQSGPVIGHGV